MLLEEISSHLMEAQGAHLLSGFEAIVRHAISRAPTGDFRPAPVKFSNDLPSDASLLTEKIIVAEGALKLATWFRNERPHWITWWDTVSQSKGEASSVLSLLGEREKIEGPLTHLVRLSEAVDEASPFTFATDKIRRAWRIGSDIAKIESEQARRELIAEALQPLKNLNALAESIAREAITDLSGRISSILNAIHISESFQFYDAHLDRREGVTVRGGFASELRIDATLVANTSWLRAVLWSFLFALREEAIEQFKRDAFPVMLFDDPQATFDAEHRHRWAQYVASLQSAAARMQVIITTFDESFLDLIKMDGIRGRHAMIAGASPEIGHVGIFEGEALDRLWEEVRRSKSPLTARSYMMEARIHLEGMLKLMLRGEDPGVPKFTVNDLRKKLQQLYDAEIPPWNNPAFRTLLAALDRGRSEMKYLEASHHTTRQGLGITEADSVERHWRKTLHPELVRCFRIARDHRLLHGGLKALHSPPPVAAFPEGYKEKVRAIPLTVQGRAAALTNGRAADGCLSFEGLSSEKSSRVVLGHHSAYRLLTATLEPVARPGDILLVKEQSNPSPRSLVVATSGGRIVARRFEVSENFSDVVVLTAQAVNPREIAAPLVVQKSTLTSYKIVGILFDEDYSPITGSPEVEIGDCGGEATLSRLTSNALGLVEVIGQSAEPLALDGQYLIVLPEVLTPEALKRLDGRPVIAADEEDNRYFKRLRFADNRVILESMDAGGSFRPIILLLPGDSKGVCLRRVWPVVGVLFEISN